MGCLILHFGTWIERILDFTVLVTYQECHQNVPVADGDPVYTKEFGGVIIETAGYCSSSKCLAIMLFISLKS